ncbi:hypothetical protein CLOBL_02300 [Clostridium sp. BL-8]|nr:hypothetical protein CLOBL_02300 [Clostridium sp. BL-8]
MYNLSINLNDEIKNSCLGSQVSQVTQDVQEFKFSKGKVCPLCGSETISRNGKYNCKQRYIYKSRKRGKQTKKMDISNEHVCIATAIDRQGDLACKYRITSTELEKLYNANTANSSILCTDRHKSYVQFANRNPIYNVKISVICNINQIDY